MKYSYKPRGVCTREMEIETENGKIKKVVMKGGCMGNTLGISSLVSTAYSAAIRGRPAPTSSQRP